MRPFEWGDLLFFLELVRRGSHSAAAKRLKVDHTTVRRRISALETGLRARLFAVVGTGIKLTAEGESLLQYAESIENLVVRAIEEVSNRDLAVSGTVRIGAPEGFGTAFLASRLAAFCAENPGLNARLLLQPRTLNLANGEADIAIGFGRPAQRRQIARKLTDYRLSLFASRSYIDGAPPLASIDDLREHRMVSYVDEIISDNENDLESQIPAWPDIESAFQSSSIYAQKSAIVAGFGLGFLPEFMVADGDDLVRPLGIDHSIVRELWMIIHPEMINLARVRLLVDFIVEAVRKERRFLLGDPHV